ncbi:hypothetical protein KPH14_011518 [Odynerus spinipes]|uniref:Leucine-rich repeat-containing protein 27 n=1 Tax=Odynerus spinipes TaxID=1348599 RepID=A0AAD9RJI2_9HYME|nr:hypothetical protein KPH14_011518 [Odynerus spinipes]
MINITRELLKQYYGFHDESINADDRSLSIHKCIPNISVCEEENIGKDIILNENEKILIKEEDVQSDTDHDKQGSTDLHAHNFCALDTKEKEDKNIISKSYTSLESYFVNNVVDNDISLNTALYEDNTKVSHSVSDELCTNELCPMSADDCLDTASDISSVVVQEAPRRTKKHYADFPPIPNKAPIYNSMFVDLSDAKLLVIPDNVLQKFSGIRMLYLENNTISEIPDKLFPSLQNLEWLDIRNNQLQCLPKNIKSHPSLHTLLLQGNRIQILPLELCSVPKLKNLQVANNPLIMPPKDVIALGCSNILNFLKSEWNKLNPNEVIIPVKETKLKSLTVLTNESVNKKEQNVSQIVNCYSCNDIPNKFNKISVIGKRKAYKPNNGCDSKGLNIDKQRQLLWINEITDILNKEASALQKIKDKIAIQGWRDDRSSFHKSMNKAAKRGEGDIPYAIDTANDLSILSILKAKNKLRRSKATFVPPSNINDEIIKLLDSLNEINRNDDITNMTPTSKQKFLSDKIKKVCMLQHEIRHLQRYNDITAIP